jgi:hypothetical protein
MNGRKNQTKHNKEKTAKRREGKIKTEMQRKMKI